MDEEKIKQHLGFWLGDTCNRFLSALLEIGVIEEKKMLECKQEVLDAKGDLLDEWTPQYWEFLQKMMKE